VIARVHLAFQPGDHQGSRDAILDAELAEHALDVLLDRPRRDAEDQADFAVGLGACDPEGHLFLPGREIADARRGTGATAGRHQLILRMRPSPGRQ
jgi:hypothetical protein